MRSLLADPARAARLGAEGRAVVSDGFGIDRMIEESLGLYRSLLAGQPAVELRHLCIQNATLRSRQARCRTGRQLVRWRRRNGGRR